MQIANKTLLRKKLSKLLQTTKRDGLSALGHVHATWIESGVYAGDHVTIEMLRGRDFDPYVMSSWLTYYRVFRESVSYDDRLSILTAIEKNRGKWISSTRPAPRLFSDVYQSLIANDVYDCFVLATKVCWLMRPADFAIYDNNVASALSILQNDGCVCGFYWRNSNPKGIRTKQTTASMVRYYEEFDALMREISTCSEKELNSTLGELSSRWFRNGSVPQELRKNRLRLLDKAFWILGAPSR